MLLKLIDLYTFLGTKWTFCNINMVLQLNKIFWCFRIVFFTKFKFRTKNETSIAWSTRFFLCVCVHGTQSITEFLSSRENVTIIDSVATFETTLLFSPHEMRLPWPPVHQWWSGIEPPGHIRSHWHACNNTWDVLIHHVLYVMLLTEISRRFTYWFIEVCTIEQNYKI